MSSEERKIILKRVNILSIVILLGMLAGILIVGVLNGADTIMFPGVAAVFLLLLWIVNNVLAVKWLNEFEGKTEDQKKFFYIYAAMEMVSYIGLVYFLADMRTMTGAMIYVVGTVMKRKFKEDFNGEEEEESEEDFSESMLEIEDKEDKTEENQE